MLPQTVLLALVAAVGAVPLNINLGAYSPALVVGDGEISLGSGGAGAASEIMSTLASGTPPAAGGQAKPAKRNNVRRALEALFDRSPMPAQDDKLAAYEEAMHWIKRDINGFNAALSYAREAMKNQPKVEMGSEGAGVGIVVSPGVSVPANSAANGAPAGAAGGEKPAPAAAPAPAGEKPKVKRSEVVAEDESPKMTLVAITEV